MTINERVKSIRKAKSLTQEEFGKKIAMSKSTISDVEKGNRSVTDRTVLTICREFGVREAWLRDGEGEMFQPEPVDEIEAICRKYGLNQDAQIMIEKFVVLPADQRRAILEYIRSVVDAFGQCESMEDAETQYKRGFDSARSTASSALNITEDMATDETA